MGASGRGGGRSRCSACQAAPTRTRRACGPATPALTLRRSTMPSLRSRPSSPSIDTLQCSSCVSTPGHARLAATYVVWARGAGGRAGEGGGESTRDHSGARAQRCARVRRARGLAHRCLGGRVPGGGGSHEQPQRAPATARRRRPRGARRLSSASPAAPAAPCRRSHPGAQSRRAPAAPGGSRSITAKRSLRAAPSLAPPTPSLRSAVQCRALTTACRA